MTRLRFKEIFIMMYEWDDRKNADDFKKVIAAQLQKFAERNTRNFKKVVEEIA